MSVLGRVGSISRKNYLYRSSLFLWKIRMKIYANVCKLFAIFENGNKKGRQKATYIVDY